MATPTAIESRTHIESPQDRVQEEQSSEASEEDSDVSSPWEIIYRSIKDHLQAGTFCDTDNIFQFADSAIIHGDPECSLLLYALALTQLRVEHNMQPSVNYKAIDRCSEILCLALSRSLLVERCTDLGKMRKSELCQAVDDIVCHCDALLMTNAQLLTNAAALYLRLEEHLKALHLCTRAMEKYPENCMVQDTYENLCCHLVERWHFIMLNDKARNSAYQKAITAAADQFSGKIVICDIGSGTGLLSLIACQHSNTSEVYAIEKSSVMCKVADKVFKANLGKCMAQKAQIINKLSTQMSGLSDMHSRANILVTETFDAGFFGEGILPTLCHAWSNLIVNNGIQKGQVIPGKAQLFMQVVESPYIYQENSFIGSLEGLDVTNFHIHSTVGLLEIDPYAAHDLKNVPDGFKTLSNPVPFMDVDLNNSQDLSRLNQGFVQKISSHIAKSGRMDAIIVWFSLYLTEEVVLSTHMECNSCWEQAVFPVHPIKMVKQTESKGKKMGLVVEEGDTVSIDQLVKGSKLCMSVTSVSRGNTVETECNPRSLYDEAEGIPKFLTDPLEWCQFDVYCLNSWELSALNDTYLQSLLLQTIKELLSQTTQDNSQVHLIHLNNGFSPLCLQAIQLGYSTAVCVANNQVHAELIKRIAVENGIDWTNIILTEDVRNRKLANSKPCAEKSNIQSSDFSQNVAYQQFATDLHKSNDQCIDVKTPTTHIKPQEPTINERSQVEFDKETSFSPEDCDVPVECDKEASLSPEGVPVECSAVVVCDLIDYQGRLLEGLSDLLTDVRICLSKYSGSVVTPCSFDVLGVLVDSEHLLRQSCVQSDKNTLGFKIGTFINSFAVKNYQGITLETLPHEKLSAPFKMFSVDVSNLVGRARSYASTSENILQQETDPHTSDENLQNSKVITNDNFIAAGQNDETVRRSSAVSQKLSENFQNKAMRSKGERSVTEKGSTLSGRPAACGSKGIHSPILPFSEPSYLTGLSPTVPLCFHSDSTADKHCSTLRPTKACEELKRSKTSFHTVAGISDKRHHQAGTQCNENVDEEKMGDHAAKYRNIGVQHNMDRNQDPSIGDLNQTVNVKVPIISEGILTALVYWFNLHWSPGHTTSTLDPTHHWQQAAVMVPSSCRQHFKQGDVVALHCQIYNSTITFSLPEDL